MLAPIENGKKGQGITIPQQIIGGTMDIIDKYNPEDMIGKLQLFDDIHNRCAGGVLGSLLFETINTENTM
jgi:hypothetical protein